MMANFLYILVARHRGPVPGQYAPCPWIDLHLPRALHTGPLQPEVKAADASEQRAEPHLFSGQSHLRPNPMGAGQ